MPSKGTGKTGLVNLGNTCFMNACLQCVSHLPELVDICSTPGARKVTQDGSTKSAIVTREWMQLRELMWTDDCVVSPAGFLASIQNAAREKGASLFTGFAQNDVGEFLRFLLITCMHQALATPVKMTVSGQGATTQDRLARVCYEAMAKLHEKDYSPIVAMFYGMGTSTVMNQTINKITAEPYFILSLPVPRRHCTIYECFDMHVKASVLNGDNQYETDGGDMVDATKQDGFWSFAKILILELKRFSNDLSKNNCKVEFPTDTLSLSKYAASYDARQYNYELFGVCNHSGRTCGGHYTAYARTAGGTWNRYDDRVVSRIGPSDVVSSNAYCLFYRKKPLMAT